MAPEQVLNAKQATEQSDLYAVGAILYRAVTGAPAFAEHEEAKDIARAKVTGEALPFETGRDDPAARALEELVTRAMRRRPAERPRSAREMREQLARARVQPAGRASEDGVEPTERTSLPDVLEAQGGAPPAPRLPETPRPRKGGWTAAAVAGVLLVFVGGVATGRLWTLGGLEAPPKTVAAAALPAELQPTHPAPSPAPSIEPAQILPEIAELSVASASDSTVVTAPTTITAPLARPSPSPAPVAVAEDDNPY
jgi:serine/threonine-protein kinase